MIVDKLSAIRKLARNGVVGSEIRGSGRVVASLDRKCLGREMSGGGGMLGRGVFDKETRRKPLALAADAYGD
jgi:hypothetical protein